MKRIVLITGATSGIGRACAKLYAEKGHSLILTGRRAERLDRLQEELQKAHQIEVLTLVFDVRNKVEVHTVLDSIPEGWRGIEVLINNAGLAKGLSDIQDGDLDHWEQMIDTNVKGLLYVSRRLMPEMVKRKKGHIVNIGSIAGKEVYAKGNVYCASKHAVEAITKAMRIDLLPHQVKVSSVSPGAVETEFSKVRFDGDDARADQVYKGFDPLRAEDIADAVYFITSRPQHININDLLIMPTAQANSSHLLKD